MWRLSRLQSIIMTWIFSVTPPQQKQRGLHRHHVIKATLSLAQLPLYQASFLLFTVLCWHRCMNSPSTKQRPLLAYHERKEDRPALLAVDSTIRDLQGCKSLSQQSQNCVLSKMHVCLQSFANSRLASAIACFAAITLLLQAARNKPTNPEAVWQNSTKSTL